MPGAEGALGLRRGLEPRHLPQPGTVGAARGPGVPWERTCARPRVGDAAQRPQVQMRRFFSWIHAAERFDSQWTGAAVVLRFMAQLLGQWSPDLENDEAAAPHPPGLLSLGAPSRALHPDPSAPAPQADAELIQAAAAAGEEDPDADADVGDADEPAAPGGARRRLSCGGSGRRRRTPSTPAPTSSATGTCSCRCGAFSSRQSRSWTSTTIPSCGTGPRKTWCAGRRSARPGLGWFPWPGWSRASETAMSWGA